MEYRKLDNKELIEALPLVWNVFCEYEALDYPEYGKQAFWNAIHSDKYLNTLTAFGAFNEDKLIGIIASINAGSHVALFFVDGTYHKQGVGKSLWNTFLYMRFCFLIAAFLPIQLFPYLPLYITLFLISY